MTPPLTAARGADADLVDRLVGLAPGSELHVLRHRRDKVVAATQGSYDSLFDRALAGISLVERLLVALYACRLTPAPELAAHYLDRLGGEAVDAAAIAAARSGTPDDVVEPRLRAMLTFARTLVEHPAEGDRRALRALLTAGLSTPAAVALAQLIAFLSYQTRLVAGLKAMGAAAATAAAPGGAGDAGEEPVRRAATALDTHGFTTQSLGWKSWLDVVELDAATAEQVAVLEESHPLALVSEYYRVLVHQPEILRQRSTAFNAIMYAPGGMARAERELGATVTSRINGCVYCASVHAQRFEQLAKRSDVIEQVFDDPQQAGTNAREQAISRFSIALTTTPGALSAAAIERLQRVGLEPLEVLDLVHSVAIFAWANRLMLNLGEPVWPDAPAA
ncbi:MAG: CMD domain protein [Pseudomonadota bacterium]|nr:CMD domain protein [Pseudomonadota bacterium]